MIESNRKSWTIEHHFVVDMRAEDGIPNENPLRGQLIETVFDSAIIESDRLDREEFNYNPLQPIHLCQIKLWSKKKFLSVRCCTTLERSDPSKFFHTKSPIFVHSDIQMFGIFRMSDVLSIVESNDRFSQIEHKEYTNHEAKISIYSSWPEPHLIEIVNTIESSYNIRT